MSINKNTIATAALLALLLLSGCGDRAASFEKGTLVPVSDVDSDGDGLRDADEDVNVNGIVDTGETDPYNADTDGDGLTDGEEVNNKEDSNTTASPVGYTDPLNSCDPVFSKGYSGYDSSNKIWQAANCDNDDYLNGEEDNSSLTASDYKSAPANEEKPGYLSDPYDATSECFIFRELKYCEVDNKDGSRTWLDRVLGAKKSCNTEDGHFDDRTCWGDYYQWGRVLDGHEKSDSETRDEPFESLTQANRYAQFVTNIPDWLTDEASESPLERENAWQDSTSGKICPVGWYVPTMDDFRISLEEDDNYLERYSVSLSGGYRSGDNGFLSKEDTLVSVWSSTSYTENPHYGCHVKFSKSSEKGYEFERHNAANGSMVRCIKALKK